MTLPRLSREKRAIAAQRLKERGPKTDMQLWQWCERVLDFEIASRPTCEEHTAPFEFLADAYFMRFDVGAFHGPRGGGKTRIVSMLHLLSGHYLPRFETAHVGAVMRQAQLCYGYVRDYFKDPTFGRALIGDPLMQQTRWRSGSSLQILPGTVSGTSGPHPNRAVADEFDLIPWEVYQQFIGMPMAHGDYAAQSIYTSAMVTSYGPMSRLISESAERGLKIYRCCIFDVMAPCDGEWGGKGPTCVDAQHARQGLMTNPPACPLWNDCQGRARYATGHVRLTDVLNKYAQSDDDTWAVQFLCTRGSRKGLVYENFDANPANPAGATNVSSEAEYKPDLPVVWMTDEGYHPDPMVVLAANLLPNGNLHVFDEIYLTRTLHEQMLKYVHGFETEAVTGRQLETWPWQVIAWDPELGPRPTGEARRYKKPSAVYCGTTDKFMQLAFAQIGCTVRAPTKTGVVDGVKEVRKMVLDHNGHRALVFHPRCKNALRDFEQFHRRQVKSGEYTEDPASNTARSNPDDGCDSVRMFAAYRLESISNRIAPAFPAG